MKLNLGGGLQKIPGFVNYDRKLGSEVYPLSQHADSSVSTVRASHLLEHFPVNEVPAVINEWARVIEPGGWLKIAVPNFEQIVEWYKTGEKQITGYLLGGQLDKDDYHKSIFDAPTLEGLMKAAGLMDIQPWESEIDDCAKLQVSLNLMGRKPDAAEVEQSHNLEVTARCAAIMSVPRLGWQDNFGSCWRALRSSGFDIPLWKFGGAFWEMGIQKGFNSMIEDGVEWILVIDYDTVFDTEDVRELLTLAALYPEADAIVPLQAKRGGDVMLFTMRDKFGKLRHQADWEEFAGDLTPIHTGHFGLTLIKTAALKKIPKPWFWSQPTEAGEWDEGRIDADIYFWQKGEQHGLRIFQANHIRIGHLQVVVSWVDKDFKVGHQYLSDWNEKGKPEDCR